MFVLGDEEKDKEVFALRPMTCPFQYYVYKASQKMCIRDRDNIYLLSLEEVSNPEYGFHPLIDCESNTRKAEGTDLSLIHI